MSKPDNMRLRVAWLIMALLAFGVGGYALTTSLVPMLRPTFIENLFQQSSFSALGHLLGGGVALITGALQVNTRLRKNHPGLHRKLGWLYVFACTWGGVAALILAAQSTGGMVAHLGFSGLGIGWLITTTLAFKYIRDRNIVAHRRWMLRSYALTLAAVTLRIYLPASQVAGIDFESAYRVIAWLCWVPNLVAVECFLAMGSGLTIDNKPESAAREAPV